MFGGVALTVRAPVGHCGWVTGRTDPQFRFLVAAVWSYPYLDSEQETKLYSFNYFLGFWTVFGQSWAQQRAQRPRLEKRYMDQRGLVREIDSKAPRKLKSHIWP